ncbi:hypothetical protein ACN3XK_14800, partial [Actinomadura welshii]
MGRDERPGPGLRRTADILFSATVKAAELRIETAPGSRVEFTADADEESASGSTRSGLPDRVRESTTYRDVQIDYAIAAK